MTHTFPKLVVRARKTARRIVVRVYFLCFKKAPRGIQRALVELVGVARVALARVGLRQRDVVDAEVVVQPRVSLAPLLGLAQVRLEQLDLERVARLYVSTSTGVHVRFVRMERRNVSSTRFG